MIREKLESVMSRIAAAAVRSGLKTEDVKLVAVTKNVGLERIEEALACGVTDIGENRVQEAAAKYNAIGDRAVWHLIGHLQTNKAKDAVRIFSLIHSVDSERLAKEIDKEAAKVSKVQDILVEVNISGEGQKYGIPPETVEAFIAKLYSYHNIKISGLMGMAPVVSDSEEARPYFRKLKGIFQGLSSAPAGKAQMRYLSMGMSQDFEVAVEEGADIVRVGSAIFA